MPAHISEVSYAGARPDDFVEIRVEAGTDMSGYSLLVYDSSGSVTFTNTFTTADATMAGSDIYIINDLDAGGLDLRDNRAVALVDDLGHVLQFITFEGSAITGIEGPAHGITATRIGTSANGNSLQSDDGGASYYEQTSPNPGTVPGHGVDVVPCYALGTLIETPKGPRAVETLQVGDLVLTYDHGPQAVRWIHSSHHQLENVTGEAKPVLIAVGALGTGIPAQNLVVSPQHRILVGASQQLLNKFKTDVFVPAKSLTGLPGIRHMKGKKNITWVHFAFDNHEVVYANGCLSESLLLGPMVVNAMSALARQRVIEIFGTAASVNVALNGFPARACLTVGAVQRQLAPKANSTRHQGSKEIRSCPQRPARVTETPRSNRYPLSSPAVNAAP